MNDTLLRQWEMLRFVPRLPGKISTSDLKSRLTAAGYDVHLRTIQRDLNDLSVVLPLVGDDAKPQGWSWRKDAHQMDVPALGPQAALAFKLVEEHLRRLLPTSTLDYLAPWFQTAGGVLDSQGDSALSAWPQKIRVLSRGLPQQPPAIDPGVQDAIYRGLLLAKKVEVTYQAPWFDGTKDYVVNPLALVVRDGQVYLVCTMWDYGDVRHLLLHRMLSAQVMNEDASRLDGFDLDAHIAQGEFSYPVEPVLLQLEAEFTGYAAASIAESPLSADQTLERLEDGGVLARVTVPDTLELRSWLMGLGSHVTVTAPQSLVEEMAETVAELAERYLKE